VLRNVIVPKYVKSSGLLGKLRAFYQINKFLVNILYFSSLTKWFRGPDEMASRDVV